MSEAATAVRLRKRRPGMPRIVPPGCGSLASCVAVRSTRRQRTKCLLGSSPQWTPLWGRRFGTARCGARFGDAPKRRTGAEERLAAPILNLSQAGELGTVVYGDSLEYLAEAVSVLLFEPPHSFRHRIGVLSGDTQGDVILGFLLQQGEYNRLFACPPANRGIALPVAFFEAESGNFRTLGDFISILFLVLTSRGVLAPLAFQRFRQFCRRQAEIASPRLVVEGMGANRFFRRKQAVQSGVADAGVQRPLAAPDSFSSPIQKADARQQLAGPLGTRSIRLVDGLSTFCRVAGGSALAALTRRRRRAAVRFGRRRGNSQLLWQWLCLIDLDS